MSPLLHLPMVLLAVAPREAPVVRVLHEVARTVRVSHYAHVTRVDVRHGRFDWDCSGMVAWVLDHAAPDAEVEIERARRTHRPVARDYQAFIAGLAPGRTQASWQRVERLDQARPGDVIAWVFPPWIRTTLTGHVAFVMAPPTLVEHTRDRWRVRVADATSVPHAEDSRVVHGTSGFGTGVIEFRVDPVSGAAVGYRWNDRPGRGTLRTAITLARVVSRPATTHRP